MIIIILLICLIIILTNKDSILETFVNNNLTSNCCLVTKNFDNGKFKYNYRLLDCNDAIKYNIADSNSMVFNNREICQKEKEIGSCRYANKECFDFMTKEQCNNLKILEWSEKTCHDKLPFVFRDKIKYKKPENKDNQKVIMF